MSHKTSKDELEPSGACHEGQRESAHTVMGRKSHNKQINKIALFVWQKGAAQPTQVSGGG